MRAAPRRAAAAAPAPARTRAWSSSASSASRQLRDRVRRPASAAPDPTGLGGVVGVGADPLGQCGEQAGEQRVRGRVEPEPGRAGAQEVEVLGTAHGAPVDRLDVDQADLAQPLEVQAHGVGVDAEALGEVRADSAAVERASSSVHRVAGLVAERLQHRELVGRIALVHVLDGTRRRAYFQDVACIILTA